jgi:crossover junction endodeoxyribonuclease RusA
MIEYTIPGTPRPQGSKKHVGRGIMIESSKYIADWRAFARLKAEIAMREHAMIRKPHPVAIEVVFYFDRPKSHSTTKGLRDTAPTRHTSKPDIDKLLRALLDSMTGIVFEDDSQVWIKSASKCYGISVTFLKVQT